MNLSKYLSIATLAHLAGGVLSDCPCFTSEELAQITRDTMNESTSCIDDPDSLDQQIWQNRPEPPAGTHARVAPGRAMGYEVHGGDTCLIQGDILMKVSPEEADACKRLIAAQCQINNVDGYDM